MPKPLTGSYPAYFNNYISQVNTDSVNEAIDIYAKDIISFFKKIPQEKAMHSYAPGKWTIKEMLQHIIDAERVFAYRAMSLARKEKTSLPGFDEDEYAANSKANNRNWNDMLNEFEALRQSTDLMLQSFDEEQINSGGVTNNAHNNVNAIAFVVFGHILHHKKVLEERYF